MVNIDIRHGHFENMTNPESGAILVLIADLLAVRNHHCGRPWGGEKGAVR